jgi:hypothetical protein
VVSPDYRKITGRPARTLQEFLRYIRASLGETS